jgi:hypothetical protein
MNIKMQEFHIHIDAVSIDTNFEEMLVNSLSFSLKNFSVIPTESERHAPDRHLTYKTRDARTFHQQFDAIEQYLSNHPLAMEGYVEGEIIPGEILIPSNTFDPDVAIPFVVDLSDLDPGEFREDEIHITLDADCSDPRLLLSLGQMGFFSVFMDKPYGRAKIFTTQGSRRNIQQILPLLTEYLIQAGGAVNCVVKEEIVSRFWLSSPSVRRPPTIALIHQSSTSSTSQLVGIQ